MKTIRAAWALPIDEQLSVAYLIQGEEDTSDKEAAMWSPVSDAFVLTFRTQRPTALFFPNSRLAEGRNVLLAAAALAEFKRATRYRYYAFLDADAQVPSSWNRAVFRFEAFLRDWEPAVGLPAYADAPAEICGGSSPVSVFLFDDIFVAVHAEAAPVLLPYQTKFDRKCAWVSQWIFKLLACALYRNHTLMLPSVRVHNPGHSTYPKQDCFIEYGNASSHLRAVAPESAGSCFPDPLIRGFLFAHGKLGPTSYLPWGTAKRKHNDSSLLDYGSASLDTLTSCEEEMAVVRHFTQPRVHRFCPGCSSSAVLYILQTTIAKNPLWAPNWQELGVLVWGALGDVPVASVCVAISRRLQALRGRPPVREVEETAMMLDQELAQRGLAPAAFASDWLWLPGAGRRNLEGFVRVALTSSHGRDAADPFLLSEPLLQWFLDILLGHLELLGERPQGRNLGDWAEL